MYQAINAMPLNKMPGADGFPADWYRAFAKELSPVLSEMYNDCLSSDSKMTEVMRMAVISLVYKQKAHTLTVPGPGVGGRRRQLGPGG